MGTPSEPSMEDILSSIRKIISENDDTGTAKEAQSDSEAPPLDLGSPLQEEPALPLDDTPLDDTPFDDTPFNEAPPDEAPLDLGSVVEEDAPLDLTEKIDFDPQTLSTLVPSQASVDREREEEQMEDEGGESFMAQADGESLVSDRTESEGVSAFSQLEKTVRMGYGGETLEEVIKGLLRPMLRAWLDQNLPSLVEGLVEQEIQKMAGTARRSQAQRSGFVG